MSLEANIPGGETAMGPTQNSAIFPALADQTADNQIDAVDADDDDDDDDDDGSTSGGLRLRGTVGDDALIGGLKIQSSF